MLFYVHVMLCFNKEISMNVQLFSSVKGWERNCVWILIAAKVLDHYVVS